MALTLQQNCGLLCNCGPLAVTVLAQDQMLADSAGGFLSLFTAPWDTPARHAVVELRRETAIVSVSGSFLNCAHMAVDRARSEYAALTHCNFAAQGDVRESGDAWRIAVPPETQFGEAQIGDMEDLLSLVCTVGWRKAGWIALHAGAVAKNGAGLLLCAPSGGGKSTLTAALLRAGWQAAGDDKVLLRREGDRPVARALLHTMNLHPQSERWFDVGGIEQLPRYSAWTQKRRVSLQSLAHDGAIASCEPTHVVKIERTAHRRKVRARAMERREILPALLRQIVLPLDPAEAGWIVAEAAACLRHVRGIVLEIGEDAYADPAWIRPLESAL